MAAPKLRRGNQRLFDAAQLLDDEIDDLADRFVRAPRVDRERAGVAIGAQAAEYRIGQSTLLANVLKQPRAHRAAEQRIEHVAGIPIVVVLRIAAGAEAQVALLELLVANQNIGDDRRRLLACRFAHRRQIAELRVDQIANVTVLEVADRRHNQVSRRVGVLEIAAAADRR